MTYYEIIKRLENIQDKCTEQVKKDYKPVDIFNYIEDLIEDLRKANETKVILFADIEAFKDKKEFIKSKCLMKIKK